MEATVRRWVMGFTVVVVLAWAPTEGQGQTQVQGQGEEECWACKYEETCYWDENWNWVCEDQEIYCDEVEGGDEGPTFVNCMDDQYGTECDAEKYDECDGEGGDGPDGTAFLPNGSTHGQPLVLTISDPCRAVNTSRDGSTIE